MKNLTLDDHRKQIEVYGKVRGRYEVFAKLLQRLLSGSCRISLPEAFIQTRVKTISSFAEKAARKFSKYPDAVNQMTDLCGARVIVQTADQVKAVRQFIEANFEILEREDKELLLAQDEFGYRDMHYIVRLRPSANDALQISEDERRESAGLRAEVQVRTWVQHAWADTLHDRMYKNKLKLSRDAVRAGALLAALMEEGDRSFNDLADRLDGLIANYTAYATKKDVQDEIEVQDVILGNEPDPQKRPVLALKLARLCSASGNYARVVELLEPYAKVEDANRSELLLEFGYGLCKLNDYSRAERYLDEAVRLFGRDDVPFVPDLRRREGLHARALSRLGVALESIEGQEHRARESYRLAHEHEPSNPYYLADMLGFEIFCARGGDLPSSMRTTIREAIRTCDRHAAAGIEQPYAWFTAGRLNLLLENWQEAWNSYSRGVAHCLQGIHCVPSDVLADQIRWLKHIHFGVASPPQYQRIIDLLTLGQIADGITNPPAGSVRLASPVLIVAGSAGSLDREMAKTFRELIAVALRDFHGTVISGGTGDGVPGCVGDIAADLQASGKRHFRLVGYLPNKLSAGEVAHAAFDECVRIGESFAPEQILGYWSDLLASGIRPAEVRLLGFGGGPLSAIEYRIALALGASVGLVMNTQAAAAQLLADPTWSTLPHLYSLPLDSATLRAFLVSSSSRFEGATEEEMAKMFHNRYVASSSFRLPENLRPWEELPETFKNANIEQAKYAVEILRAGGFGVRPAGGSLNIFKDFTESEIEHMAILEHGRWNVERLRNGWRFGNPRDDSRKIHDCLVSWAELPEPMKVYDREAVRLFPETLAKAGMEVYRQTEIP